MAETFRVNIEFTGEQRKLLRIPEKIEVPQFSIFQWIIVNVVKYYYESNFWRRGLVFTIYFDVNRINLTQLRFGLTNH